MADLTKLVTLYLSNNGLKTLPKWIGYMKELEELTLSHNFLTTLPKTIGGLRKLKKLHLRHNNFTPEGLKIIRLLKNLNDLDLSLNNLGSENFALLLTLLENLPHGCKVDLRDNGFAEWQKNEIRKLPNIGKTVDLREMYSLRSTWLQKDIKFRKKHGYVN